MDESEDEVEAGPSQPAEERRSKKLKKIPKRGIIYLSTIPPYMNVSKIHEVFSEFGKVGRVYLQLAETSSEKGKKKLKKSKAAGRIFTEGWVEFERKSVAKRVAMLLNNKQVDLRKSSKHYDCLWNIKYLSGFKWTHLHERLAYEKNVRRQKLKAEIKLAKKKGDFFADNVKNSKNKNKDIINKEFQYIDMEAMPIPEEKDTSGSSKKSNLIASLFG